MSTPSFRCLCFPTRLHSLLLLLPPLRHLRQVFSKSDRAISSLGKQGNTASDLKMPREGSGRVTSRQAPSTLTVMSCPQQGEEAHKHRHTDTHTHTHTHIHTHTHTHMHKHAHDQPKRPANSSQLQCTSRGSSRCERQKCMFVRALQLLIVELLLLRGEEVERVGVSDGY